MAGPRVFSFGSGVARLRWHDDRLVIELLDKDGLGNYLSKVADWRNVYYTKRGVEYEAVFPPTRAITDVLTEPGWPLPPIERVGSYTGIQWRRNADPGAWIPPAGTDANGWSAAATAWTWSGSATKGKPPSSRIASSVS